MAEAEQDGVFEERLKKLRQPEADSHSQEEEEDDDDDDSPAADLVVQARVDSVALAKGRLSSGSGSGPPKDRLEGKDRTSLPPTGAKSRLGNADKDKQKASGGFKGVTRKLRNSLGFGEKEREPEPEPSKPPPDLATHVSFNDRVEEVPVPGGPQ